jgi:Integrase core domain
LSRPCGASSTPSCRAAAFTATSSGTACPLAHPEQAPAVTFHTDAPAGFIHIDVKYLPPLNRRRSYAYVAIDRATRFVYLEILSDRRAETAVTFLARLLHRFPLEVHSILTDNGSEFTDRFDALPPPQKTIPPAREMVGFIWAIARIAPADAPGLIKPAYSDARRSATRDPLVRTAGDRAAVGNPPALL